MTITNKQTRQIQKLLRCGINLINDRFSGIYMFEVLLDKLGLNSNVHFKKSTYS